ncbi:unnamed protein product [Spirodela intermedia]|uniref:Uncharacterized protein n=1 Tax=Spirodela intermedia TaxID=51605 RepID=A0A7I8JCB7_SPIIN|nr:unnamed protein product [Spirodela intermedia]CAA6667817.1 unnamed protein product [Spirodela intermedia]
MWAPRVSSGGGIRQLPWISGRRDRGRSRQQQQPPATAEPATPSRTQLDISQHVFVCKARLEREEAKAVLSLFLRKQGSSNAVASRTINRSDQFIEHLISKLHSIHKSRYLVGRELTTLEIRNALVPYLEALLEEHGTSWWPSSRTSPTRREGTAPPPPAPRRRRRPPPPPTPPPRSSAPSPAPPNSAPRSPPRPHPLPPRPRHGPPTNQAPPPPTRRRRSDIPTIIFKRPQLCGISLSENLLPTMAFLEELGVDKNQWAKVIYRFPALLTYSRHKLKSLVDYLLHLGVPQTSIGKILTRCPHIVSYSVEDKLEPTAAYFRSIGVDVAALIRRCPQTFFFLQRGFCLQEVAAMVAKYGALYTFSLAENMTPKWEFFLSTGTRRRSFLEERIKPRYAKMTASGVRLVLNQVLSVSDADFDRILEKKKTKLDEDDHLSALPRRRRSNGRRRRPELSKQRPLSIFLGRRTCMYIFGGLRLRPLCIYLSNPLNYPRWGISQNINTLRG